MGGNNNNTKRKKIIELSCCSLDCLLLLLFSWMFPFFPALHLLLPISWRANLWQKRQKHSSLTSFPSAKLRWDLPVRRIKRAKKSTYEEKLRLLCRYAEKNTKIMRGKFVCWGRAADQEKKAKKVFVFILLFIILICIIWNIFVKVTVAIKWNVGNFWVWKERRYQDREGLRWERTMGRVR